MKKLSKILCVTALALTMTLSGAISLFSYSKVNASTSSVVTVSEYASAINSKLSGQEGASASYVVDAKPWFVQDANMSSANFNARTDSGQKLPYVTGIKLTGKEGAIFDLGFVDLNKSSVNTSAEEYVSFLNVFPFAHLFKSKNSPAGSGGTQNEIDCIEIFITNVYDSSEFINVKLSTGSNYDKVKLTAKATNNSEYKADVLSGSQYTFGNVETTYEVGWDANDGSIDICYSNGAIYANVTNKNKNKFLLIRNFANDESAYEDGTNHTKWNGFTQKDGKTLVNVKVKLSDLNLNAGQTDSSVIITKLGEHNYEEISGRETVTKDIGSITYSDGVANNCKTYVSQPATYEMDLSDLSFVTVEPFNTVKLNSEVTLNGAYKVSGLGSVAIDGSVKIYKKGADAQTATTVTMTQSKFTHTFVDGGEYVLEFYDASNTLIATSSINVYKKANGIIASEGSIVENADFNQAGSNVNFKGINLTGSTGATFDLGYIDLKKSYWDGTYDSLTGVGNSFVDFVFNPSASGEVDGASELSGVIFKISQGDKYFEFNVYFEYFDGAYNEFVLQAKADNQTDYKCYRTGESNLQRRTRKGIIKKADSNLLYGKNKDLQIGMIGKSEAPVSFYYEDGALYCNSTYRDVTPLALTTSYLVRHFTSDATNVNNGEAWTGFEEINGSIPVNVTATFGTVNSASGKTSIVITKLGNNDFTTQTLSDDVVLGAKDNFEINFGEEITLPTLKTYNVFDGLKNLNSNYNVKKLVEDSWVNSSTGTYENGANVEFANAGYYKLNVDDKFSIDVLVKPSLTFEIDGNSQVKLNGESVINNQTIYVGNGVENLVLEVEVSNVCDGATITLNSSEVGNFTATLSSNGLINGGENEYVIKVNASYTKYTITYKFSDGYEDVVNDTVFDYENRLLQNVDLATAPSKDGLKFKGWYYNGEIITSISQLPLDSVTLYGVYVKNKNQITFNLGGEVSVQDVENGKKPINYVPTKDGYVFKGWYTDENYTTKFDFNSALNSNVTVYAKWEQKIVNNGSEVDDNVAVDNTITPNEQSFLGTGLIIGGSVLLAGAIAMVVITIIKKRKNK